MFTKLAYLTFFIFVLLGCKQASSLLEKTIQPKSHSYQKGIDLLYHCHFEKLAKLLNQNQNKLLKNSEQGLLSYYQNELKHSNKYFDVAIEVYRNNENKALLDVSSFLSQEYEGEGYDKAFLHNYKAINYLILGNAESARVEAKNSNIVQAENRLKLNRLKDEEKNTKNQYLLSRYDKLFQGVNPKHNPYQNPFAYYVSALGYAENKDFSNALIDIKHAITFAPNSKILQEKLKLYSDKKDTRSVEIFFDVGESPLKSQINLEMELKNGEKRMVALPSFSLSKSNIDYIDIVDNKGVIIARSSLLTDINAIKINEFKEKLPAILSILSRELVLSVGSEALGSQSTLLAGAFKAGMAIYTQVNISTWSLLPQKILVASFPFSQNKRYKILAYSKNGTVLNESSLIISANNLTTNIYRHFFFRKNTMCKSEN